VHHFIGNFKGTNRLWHVFWLHNFLLGGLVTALVDPIVNTENAILIFSFLALAGVWYLWVVVGLWQCAFNTKYRFLGYLSRIISVACVVGVAIIFFK